jgi:ribonuclease J
MILDAKYNILEDPEVVPFGLPENDREGELIEDLLYDAAVSAVQSIPREKRRDLALVREAVRRAVRSATNEAWGKKPIVTVFVTKV